MSGRMYRIGEAAALLGLKSYVLRFWETEFPQLEPVRTERGQRLYTEEHIDLLRLIRHLLHERGLTIDGARRILNSPDSRKVLREDALSTLSELPSELFPESELGVKPEAANDRFGGEEFDDSRFDDDLDAAAVEIISGWLSFLDEVTEELTEIRGLLAPLGDESAEPVCGDEDRGRAVSMSAEVGRGVAGSGESEPAADGVYPAVGEVDTAAGVAAVVDSEIIETEDNDVNRAGNLIRGNEVFKVTGVRIAAQPDGEPAYDSHGTEFHYGGQKNVSRYETETTPAINSVAVSSSMPDHDASSVVVTMPGSAGGTVDPIATDITTELSDRPVVETMEPALSDYPAPAVSNGDVLAVAAVETSLACAADHAPSDYVIAPDSANPIRDNLDLAGGVSASLADAPVAAVFTEAKAVTPGSDLAYSASGIIGAADPPTAHAFTVRAGSLPEAGAPMHGSAAVAQNSGPTPVPDRPIPQSVTLSAEPDSLPERIAAWEISGSGSASVNLAAFPAQEYREPAADSESAAASMSGKANLVFSPEPKSNEGDFSFSPDIHATEILTSPVASDPGYSGEPASTIIKTGKTEAEAGNAPEFASLCSYSSGDFTAAPTLEAASPAPLGSADTCRGDICEDSSAGIALNGGDCSNAGNCLISGDKADADPLAPLSAVGLNVSGLKADSLQAGEQEAAGLETSGAEVSEMQVNALWADDEDDDMENLEFEFSPAPDEERK